MAQVSFEELAERLTPEALELFQEMASAHLESTGDRMFLRADSGSGTHMIFTGEASGRTFEDFDGGAIDDLISWGLLHVDYSSRGTPNYRVSGEALRFYRWLMESKGAAIDQADHEIRRTIEGAAYAKDHPGAAHHLREAFDLLWTGRTDNQVVSEIGDHLRKALMDATTDVLAAKAGGDQERPIQRLKDYLADLELPTREADVMAQVVELARVTLRLDHRLNHIRDEDDAGEPEVSWEEIRRAAFSTALACYELERLVRQR